MNRLSLPMEVAASSAVCAAIAVCIAAGSGAVIVSAGLAHEARDFMHFDFDGVGHSPVEVGVLAFHNGRLAAGTLTCALLAPRVAQFVRSWMTALLAALLALNAGVFGVAIGAYGTRTVGATALHGPLELGALSLAGGTYMRATRQPLRAGSVLVVAVVCAFLLIAAAGLETFFGPGGSGG